MVLSGRGVIETADLKMLTAGAHVVEALEATAWRQAAAARRLGITPRQIGHRIRKYGLTPPGSAS